MVLAATAAAAWYLQAARVGEAQAPWIDMEPMPTARSEMAAAQLDGIFYVPGGLGAAGRTLDVFEAFDPSTGKWRSLATLPAAVHHAGAAAAHGKVYVAGGYRDVSFRTDNAAVWAYEPAVGEWSRVADMPFPRAAHALVGLDGLIYAVGGVGPESQELWVYEPQADSWNRGLAPLPTPREHLTAVAQGDRIYAIGGRSRGRNIAVVEEYDPAADAWQRLPEMPTPRSGLSAAVVGGVIHVGGGEELGGSRTFDAHEIFDPATGEWSQGPPLSAPRHGLASAGTTEGWYLIGGATRAGAETVVSLTPSVHLLPAVER